MRKLWILIGSFILGTPIRSLADTAKPVTPPKVEESSPDQDKAALEEAASEADKWAASHKDEKPAPKPSDTATKAPSDQPTKVLSDKATQGKADEKNNNPSVPKAPAPAAATLPGVTPPKSVPRRQGLNEMRGKLLSISYDPKALRLIVDGGYNVEFTFDQQTTIVNGGEHITVDDLGYNDVLVVRYAGKELNAIEIERVSKAPRPE